MDANSDSPLAAKITFWAALLTAVTFLVFTVCFVVVYAQGPAPAWTGIAGYAAQAQSGNPFFKILAQASMLLFGPVYVIILNGLHALAPAGKKLLLRIAADFGLAFALLSSLHYFVQLTVVRWNVASGQLAGLEPFVQSNPTAFLLAANMLGWTLFFGLSALFAAFAFENAGLDRILRAALLVNGVSVLIGGVGFSLQNTLVVFLTMNFLMGGAILVFAVALCIRYREQAWSNPFALGEVSR
jgi:hypothetical protein